MNHQIFKTVTPDRQKVAVSFAETLSASTIGESTKTSVICVRAKETVERRETAEMERVMEEFERMQMQYLHTLDGLLMQAFRKKFGKHMTTLEAICCRVDHHQGGPSIYYYYDKPFLKVESRELVMRETETKFTATLPLDFEILEDDYVYSREDG